MKNKQLILDDLKNGLSVDEIAKKYNVTTRTVYNYKRQLKKIVSETQSESKSDSESQNETESISDKTPEINTPESLSNNDTVSNTDSESEHIEKSVTENNCSLADILNDDNDNEEPKDDKSIENIIEKNDFIPEPRKRIKSMSSIKSIKKNNRQIDKDFKPIEIKNDVDNFDAEKKCLMIQIRKYIKFFCNEPCIKDIIGITEKQINSFIKSLHNKDIATLKNICEAIKFELEFSRQTEMIPDGIKTTLTYLEKLLSVIKIDVEGCADDLFNDSDFTFYLNMVCCETNLHFNAPQILMFKFIKNYYFTYYKNKNISETKSKLNKPANENIIEKYKDL